MPTADFSLRAATALDFPAIRALIHKVRINPYGLEWRRFLVAVDEGGRVVGCGQLKPHAQDVIELASVAVEPDFRDRGVARAIIERLLGQGPRPLYLTCRSSLGPLYAKWGFRELALADMPTYFRRLSRTMSLLTRLARSDERLLVMVLQ